MSPLLKMFGCILLIELLFQRSVAFVVLSLIFLFGIFVVVLYYQYRVSAELPTGEAKEPPIKIPKSTKKEKRAPPPTPAEETGKPPDSSYFKPTNNVTNESAAANDGGAVEAVTKPSGPPTVPSKKE